MQKEIELPILVPRWLACSSIRRGMAKLITAPRAKLRASPKPAQQTEIFRFTRQRSCATPWCDPIKLNQAFAIPYDQRENIAGGKKVRCRRQRKLFEHDVDRVPHISDPYPFLKFRLSRPLARWSTKKGLRRCAWTSCLMQEPSSVSEHCHEVSSTF